MPPGGLDTLSKIVIPLVTFGLGVLVAILVRKLDQRRSDRREHIHAIAELTRDWFEQIHAVAIEIAFNENETEVERAIATYLRNRVVLPKVLFHLEFLHGSKRDHALCEAVEAFLADVTEYRTWPEGDLADKGKGMPSGFITDRYERLEPELGLWLDRLDIQLQQIARLSGALLVDRPLPSAFLEFRRSVKQRRLIDGLSGIRCSRGPLRIAAAQRDKSAASAVFFQPKEGPRKPEGGGLTLEVFDDSALLAARSAPARKARPPPRRRKRPPV